MLTAIYCNKVTYFKYYEVVIFTDFLFLHRIYMHYNNSILQNSKIFLFIIWLFQDAVLCGNDGRVIMKLVCVPEQVTLGFILVGLLARNSLQNRLRRSVKISN